MKMKITQWTLGSLNLALGDSISEVENKYGEVYKCYDQHNRRHLLRIMTFHGNNQSLMKYCQVEAETYVFC